MKTLRGPISIIPADTELKDSVWRDSLYMFPSFTDMTVLQTNGTKHDISNVNYNYYTGCFDTIGERGDTVILSTDERIFTANVEV